MAYITLEDARAYLGLPFADPSNDDELQGFIDAAVGIVEGIVGPVTPTTFDEFYNGGTTQIVLREYPVLSITSVRESFGSDPVVLTAATSAPVAVTNSYTVDLNAGVITRRNSGYTTGAFFTTGDQTVEIIYVAGRSTVPGDIRLATLETVRHLYQQTQQGGRPSFNGDAGADLIPMGFAVPNRVRQLLATHRRPPRVR